jgi:hypothetical protein
MSHIEVTCFLLEKRHQGIIRVFGYLVLVCLITMPVAHTVYDWMINELKTI